jgi:hypothetical protein
VSDSTRRAERLLRWYPPEWRVRYGDEFVELLVADIAERPRSPGRTLDVARTGLAARLGQGGLVHGLPAERRASAGLATLASAGAAFVILGTAIWSQLAIGWQWSRPATEETTVAVVLMSYLVLVFAGLGLVAAIPYGWACARRLARRDARGLLIPLLVLAASAAIIAIGARHLAAGWPGTGGHPWVRQHLVPGRVAALAWAATLSITSYWAHPGALSGFPPLEVAWMVASPFLLVCLVVAGGTLVRRIELPAHALRFELELARVGCVAMIGFLLAPCLWLAGGGTGPRNLFHIGAIDVGGAALMSVALVLAWRSSRLAGDALAAE